MYDIFSSRLFLPASLALLGGFVRVIYKGEARTLPQVLGAVCAALFVGVLTYLFIEDFKIAEGMKAALVGAAGFSAPTLLPHMENWVIGELKKKRQGS